MLTHDEKETLSWIKDNRDIGDLRKTLTIDDFDKLFSDYPRFLIWLWGEEWYNATQGDEEMKAMEARDQNEDEGDN